MSAAAEFRAAIEERDLSAIPRLFAPDARLFSPVKFSPFKGIDEITGLFTVLLATFENFRYVGELEGTALRTSESGDTATDILVFRADVGDKQIHGIDMIQLDENGQIDEFTVMIRPVSALMALGKAVSEGLAKTAP